jgi:hypothetical protein
MASLKFYLPAVCVLLCLSSLWAQGTQQNRPDLPSAPEPRRPVIQVLPATSTLDRVFPPVAQTTRQKFRYYTQQALRPGIYFAGAFYTGLTMANPPRHYPPEWSSGLEGFARNYGDFLASWGAVQMGKFATSTLLHEDARYFPSPSMQTEKRVKHALKSVLVDRSDLGQPRLAVANVAGAFAGGFIGNIYLPHHYSDMTNGMKRTGWGLVGLATSNLVDEFTPEMRMLLRKFRVPFID